MSADKKTIASLTVKIAANATAFMSGLEKAQKKMTRFSRKMQSTGKSMTRNYTAPMALIVASAVMMANSLDVSFTKIDTLVGISGKALAGMRTEVKAVSSETGLMQKDLADTLFVVTSAGLRGSEALDVVERSAKATNIGLGETKEIARAITAVMQAYGTETMGAAHATDVLTAIVREGNLEASDLAPTLGRVVGMASQLGISFEEVGANIATFTRLGVGAEEAVVGLRGVMGALLKPTEQSKAALASIGVTMSQLRDRVSKQGLASSLQFLMKQFKGNDEGLAALIPNVRALSNVLGTAGAQADNYTKIVSNLNNANGIVDKGFKKVTQTADFKFRTALVNLKNAGTELGNTFMPLAVNLAGAVSKLLQPLASLDQNTRNWIVGIGLAVAAIGPILFIIGKLVAVITTVITTVRVLTGAVTILEAGAAPIVVIILAIVAAIGAWILIAKSVYDVWESVGNFFKRLWLNIKLTFAESILALIENVEKFTSIFGLEFNNVKDSLREYAETTKTALDATPYESVGDVAGKVATSIVDNFNAAKNAVGDFFTMANGSSYNSDSGDGIKKDTAIPTAGSAIGGVNQNKSDGGLDLSGMKAQMEWVNKTRDELLNITIDIQSAFSEMAMGVADSFSDSLIAIGSGQGSMGDMFNNILISVADFCINFGKSLIASAIAAIAFKALLSNPYVALAAGAALLVAASVVKGVLSAGPEGSSSGSVSSGSNGINGDYVASGAQASIPDTITLVASGRDLQTVINTNQQINNR